MVDFQKLKKYDKPVLIIGSATDEKLLRKILENKKIYGFTNVEHESGKDHTHYRRSNMNQVLAKIAYDKNAYTKNYDFLNWRLKSSGSPTITNHNFCFVFHSYHHLNLSLRKLIVFLLLKFYSHFAPFFI